MCANKINLNSHSTLHGEGGEWTQTFKAGGVPNDSRDKEQVPVSTDWYIGNRLQVSACLKKNESAPIVGRICACQNILCSTQSMCPNELYVRGFHKSLPPQKTGTTSIGIDSIQGLSGLLAKS